jgi:putative pyruvate formate lyase activating enzyme
MKRIGKQRFSPGSIDDLLLSACSCCPRNCGADRTSGDFGVCGIGDGFEVASVFAHRGEEPVLSGRHGIANVFFKGCNLTCIYCQNYQISRAVSSRAVPATSLNALVESIAALLDGGAKSVGFVSPSHCLPQMLEVITRLENRQPRPRFVFNTNAYDCVEVIRLLEGRVDIYLPDLKYMDGQLAAELSGARDYPTIATAAIREMYRQVGAGLLLDDDDEAVRGLIIRHLVLPGYIENSKRVLRWIAEELSPSVHISLMAQYYPTPQVRNHPKLGRKLRPEEYDEVLAEFDKLGFHRGWVQELDSPDHYRPDFASDRPFREPGSGGESI